MLIGIVDLLYLKLKMDKTPGAQLSIVIDVGFLILLFLISLTGSLLLALCQTPAMGFMLAVHIGVDVGLFLILPYGKFAHGVYHYGALYRYAVEQLG